MDSRVRDRLLKVRCVIPVLSGKGGVGKSTVAANLALALSSMNRKVGWLDIDLCGPSLPRIADLDDSKVHQSSRGWVPVPLSDRLWCMSIAFLLSHKDDPVIWRGPKKTAMVKQFIGDVDWGDLDYLIIDTPPGTSDEHLALAEILNAIKTHSSSRPDGAVIVTTPQWISLSDVQKEIDFCRKTHVPIVGLIENMSGYTCPYCSECSYIFSSKGGEKLAALENIRFLGSVPCDVQLGKSIDSSTILQQSFRVFLDLARNIDSIILCSDFIEPDSQESAPFVA